MRRLRVNHSFNLREHRLALLIARLIATGWSTYALWRTNNIRDRMFHLIEKPGTPCHIDLYSQYFVRRFALQVCSVYYVSLFFSYFLRSLACRSRIARGRALDLYVPLLASVQGLSLTPAKPKRHPFAHLFQVYRTQTFRRVGPPKNVLRMYRVGL